jgi:peptidoglycan/LPS O-acetylase OafA/YrhL
VVECATLVVLASVQRASSPLHEMLRSPALVWVGKLSYGIYLWHYPIVRYLRADWHWSVTAALGFALSALLAWVSLATVERWALRLRDRSPVRAGATAPHQKGKNSFSGASAAGVNP